MLEKYIRKDKHMSWRASIYPTNINICCLPCTLHTVLGTGHIVLYTNDPCSQGMLSPVGVMHNKQYPLTHTCIYFVISTMKEKNQMLRERKTLR